MNRAWKDWAKCLIAALVLFASTSKPQIPPSASPSSPKHFTDKGNNGAATGKKADNKNGKKNNAANSAARSNGSGNTRPTPTPPRDPASQPVTQAQVKAMVTQTQHANDLESLKQKLEQKIAEAQVPPQDLSLLRHQVERSKLFGVFGILAGGTALIVLIVLFFLQARSFESEIKSLKQNAERRYNELGKEISELRRKNTDFVTGERFEGVENVVKQLKERLKPSRTFAGGAPPQQSWPQEPDVPQQMSQTSSTFVATAPAKARITTFYVDVPDRDGCFKDSSLKGSPDWDSLYKLIPDSDGTYASVEIYDDSQRFEAAMKATQDYLLPVCGYQNNPPTSAKRIKQLRVGKAERDGQVWRVIEKLQIDFV